MIYIVSTAGLPAVKSRVILWRGRAGPGCGRSSGPLPLSRLVPGLWMRRRAARSTIAADIRLPARVDLSLPIGFQLAGKRAAYGVIVYCYTTMRPPFCQ